MSSSGSTPLPPGVQRRKELRRLRRAERLRNLWRALVFSALAAGVGYGLLRQGWSLQGPAQVEVAGSQRVGKDQVIRAADLRFPLPLLGVHPRRMGTRLMETLPVQEVRVTRLMLPPRLRIELADREAVARAERRGPEGPETGYIDATGDWIRVSRDAPLVPPGDLSLLVKGWNERHRPALVKVLKAREGFGKGLQEVRFAPDGDLWLKTSQLGELRLGPSDDRLDRRLEVAAHLHRSLPGEIRGRRPQLIDLTDPDQPELSFGAPLKPAAEEGPGTAAPPPGGQ